MDQVKSVITLRGGKIIERPILDPREFDHSPEIYEIFKQVKVNIPLLDAIKQIPSYAKFLKDLCIVK